MLERHTKTQPEDSDRLSDEEIKNKLKQQGMGMVPDYVMNVKPRPGTQNPK